MAGASQHLPNDQAFQPPFDGLYLLHAFRLDADVREGICGLSRGEVKLQVLFEPIVGYNHVNLL